MAWGLFDAAPRPARHFLVVGFGTSIRRIICGLLEPEVVGQIGGEEIQVQCREPFTQVGNFSRGRRIREILG